MRHNIRSIIIVSILCFYAASCEQEVFVEPNSNTVYPYSKIFINSKPDGAKIYIAGKNTGYVTPDTIKWMPEGKYDITLKKELFFDTSFVLNTKLDSTSGILIDYYKNPRMLGNLVCSSLPSGAEIYLDNEVTGYKTPYTFKNIIPKRYNVVYSYPEHRKDSATAIVSSRNYYPVYLELEDTLDVITYNMKNSKLPSDDYTSVGEDKNGNIWLGNSSNGLIKFDGRKFYVFNKKNSAFMSSDYVSRIKLDKENNLWVGVSNALLKYDGATWQKTRSNMVYTLQVSDNNIVLAGFDRGGLLKYKSGTYVSYSTGNSGLTGNDIVSATIDKNGSIWAAVREFGIDCYDGQNWRHLDSLKNGLPYNGVVNIAASPDGTIWGMFHQCIPVPIPPTISQKIAKYENGIWTVLLTFMDALLDRELYIDKKNRVYFGTNNQIYRIVNKTKIESISNIIKAGIRMFKHPSSISYYITGQKVFIDSKDNIWVYSSPKGIIKIKNGRWNN